MENTREGDNLTIRCVASGHPLPLVTWSKAEGDLPIARTIVRDAELLILNVTLDDTGLFVCSATNSLGSNSSTFALKVKPKQPAIVGLQSTPRSENYQLRHSSYPTVSLRMLNTVQVKGTAFRMETFKTAHTTQEAWVAYETQGIDELPSTHSTAAIHSQETTLVMRSTQKGRPNVLNTKQVTGTAFEMETFKTAQTTQEAWVAYETQDIDELPSTHSTAAIHFQETTLVMQSTQDRQPITKKKKNR